eukprot:TRINITY_DN4722_c0_g1_i1.p1 TRINITY_DN4722_c0_g1~~TRINITY_DN4722_c0_g1_i1.p1  ORF type:complete len:266 (+),score=53.46 TRINITY_DN4722_c0_g1_i1:71-868(+)
MGENLFANYEQDFKDVYANIESRIRSVPSLSSDAKLAETKKANDDIRDAEDILQSMNLNARNVPGPQGQRLQGKIREYEAMISQAKKDLRRAETTINARVDRESLLGAAVLNGGVDLAVSMDQRERLLTGTERINKTNAQLAAARRQAEETVELGQGIITNLHTQRETMTRGIDKLSGVKVQIGKSSRLLQAMARRVATNKLIMAVIILVLIGAIILIVWLRWFYKKDETTTTTSSDESFISSTSTSTTTSGDSAGTTGGFSSTG